MSFDELNNIAKDNHYTGKYSLATLKMPASTRARLRDKFPPVSPSAASFTEAVEMGAAKHGMSMHMAIIPGFTGIRVWVDEDMPPNSWKLVDETGNIIKEGVVDE